MPSERITVPITDIRHHEINPVTTADILMGVTSKPRYMPSLLLYDTQGLQYFTKITEAKDYYSTQSEVSILEEHAQEIIGTVTADSVFLELGAGDLSKTGVLISALEAQKKPVVFFALDVDYSELKRSLEELVTSIQPQFVECRGLLGTYDDCATWLKQDAKLTSAPLTIVWLGSSIANLGMPEARELLSRLVGLSPRNRRMIVAVDGCAEEQRIRRAYDLAGGQSRQFVMNGLCHANRIIGSEQFCNKDWIFRGSYRHSERTFYSSVVALRKVDLNFHGVHATIEKGEEIVLIKSAKWSAKHLSGICKTAKVHVSNSWINPHGYGVYELHADGRRDRKAETAPKPSVPEQG
ncbi:MAG: hypothetical protein L6R42_001900 [Xanthoria sp. 1 TBL-2021]|nr:MAG: hypothetical protein L6R42_001900 [Xanthoria sp. 1 TBL-2021]